MFSAGLIISMLLSRLFSFTPFVVQGPSMLPTLHTGEIFVLDEGAYKNEDPKRGDIVVFAEAKKPDYFYIKRVIGLPGEHLDVTTDGIFIEQNGSKIALSESYLAHAEDQNKNYALGGYTQEIYYVPGDKYFVMGDNRSHSLDSRSFAYPFIPKEMIKGKYLFTLMY